MARYTEVVSLRAWKNRPKNRRKARRTARREGREERQREREQRRDTRRDDRQQRQEARRAGREEGRRDREEERHERRLARLDGDDAGRGGRILPPFVHDTVPEDDDPPPVGEDRRASRTDRRAAPATPVRDALPWGAPVALGPNLHLRARKGFRAAVVEVKPGLFVVAEVPQQAVEFGFGPLLLGPALARTLGRAFQRSPAPNGTPGPTPDPAPNGPPSGQPAAEPQRWQVIQRFRAAAQPPTEPPRQLPGPAPEAPQLARWLDEEVAAELGCAPGRGGGR